MRRLKHNRLRKIELLEDRRMKAGDISYDNHVLTITGEGFNDTAQIRFEGDQVHVDLYAGEAGGGTDHHDKDKDISDVTKIVFNGFAGADTVNVEVDTLDSGETLDNITLEFHGGDQNDTLTQTGGGIRTIANGDAGNDSLQGSRYNDTLDGGANDDTLEGGTNDDTLNGGANNDTYVFAGSNLGTDTINEAANVDRDTLDFSNFSQKVTVDLAIASTSTTNPQYAVNSNDLKLKLSTSTGIEDVKGSGFDDVIKGNDRGNNLYGQDGRDTIEGRAGNDWLLGGSQNDTYVFGAGNLGTDRIDELRNSDNDTLDFSGMTHGIRVDLSKDRPESGGTDADYAVNNADLKLAFNEESAIETVFGTDYEDVLLGNSRNNYLYGRGGQDSLQGRGGADELHGGADNDILYVDTLDKAYGEAGFDYFNGIKETTNPADNPSPGRYIDWGTIFYGLLQLPPQL